MTRFRYHGPESISVKLHDEQGARIGAAVFYKGTWATDDEALVAALRRAHVHGVVEVGDEPAPPPAAPEPSRKSAAARPKKHTHGAITGNHVRHEEDH